MAELDERPPANVARLVLAVAGLVFGLLLLNAGLNLIGEEHEPDLPSNQVRTSQAPGTTHGTVIAPATSTPGSIPR